MLRILSLGQRLSAGHCFRGFPTETVSLLQEIPASPFRVKVDPSHDASKVKAEGPGLSKAGKEVCVRGRPGGSAGSSVGVGVLCSIRGLWDPKLGSTSADSSGSGSSCLCRAGADEPVRQVLKVKPFQPAPSPHFKVYLSRCGKRETNPLHSLHQRGRKSPTERAVQQSPPWRRGEGFGHHR